MLPCQDASRLDYDGAGGASWMTWPTVTIGLLALYLPSYLAAFSGIWQTEEHGHGPIILAIIFWLGWQLRAEFSQTATTAQTVPGWSLFGCGLIIYAIGRIFNISSIEFSSHTLIISGIILILRGWQGLKAAWFLVFFSVFLIPMPTSLVDLITQPLKNIISYLAVEVLSVVGYPIGRSGVIISVGQYQLLVADACSGLHSMFSLAALGSLFMFVMRRNSLLHNMVMALAILPIAFTANVVRVIILILLTYHMGDEIAQGLLHGTTGMLLMLIALTGLFLLDSLIFLLSKNRHLIIKSKTQ